jgi:hypothetical protein
MSTANVDANTLAAEIAALRAENARLKNQTTKAAESRIAFRMTEKGGVSVYGLGRFPVTLYKGQWEKLAAILPSLIDFLNANAQELDARGAVTKAAKEAAKQA